MSWLEQANTGIIIKTGDGKEWYPEYDITPLTIPYNIAEFEFVEISGTLVKRSKRKGFKHRLTFYFQGDDSLDVTKRFKKSADDERAWEISHPMYGSMTVQPSSIEYDSSGLSTTKITVELLETITDEVPRVTVDPGEQIKIDVENLGETTDEAFTGLTDVKVTETNLLTDNLEEIYDEGADVVDNTDQAQEYFNLFQEANANILNYSSDALSAINSVRKVIEAPSLFEIEIKQRLTLLVTQLTNLVSGIANLVTPNEKSIFENNGVLIVGAMVNTVVNPLDDSDLENTVDVLEVIDILSDNYDLLITSLDSLQTDNGGDNDSYVPNQSSLLGLSSVVDLAISELFNIALGARQERIIFLEADDNVVNLTHRFLGYSDDNLDTFMNDNEMGLSEILQVKKGRRIKYYV